MINTTLPLSIVCDVEVSISAVAAAPPSFNQGLIVGPSTVIPSLGGSNPRIRQYTSLTGMSSDGFSASNPEYLAAQLYFSQTPAPTFLWIGRQDLTAISAAVVGSSAGTGYVVGDILTVVQSAASGGQVRVTTVGGSGAITGIEVVANNQGTGYSVASGLATTGGTGTGAQVNITAIGESALQALTACRLAASQWYGCLVTDAATADHEAIAPYVEAVKPQAIYFYTTADAAVLNNAQGNVGSVLKTASYSRTFGIYSTTQGGVFPNDAFAAAGVNGRAMGLNTGLANSNFTMKFKTLTGVATEPLSQTQVTTIEGLNVNLNLSYNDSYSWLEQGKMANGKFLDEIIGIDMLVADVQVSVVNLLTAVPSVPQTNAGESQLINAVNQACERAVTRGFLAPGVWSGQTVLDVSEGDALPKGYLCQAQSFALQSSGDRAARKAMPIYVTVIEAGSIHSLTIGLYVQV